MNITNIIVKIIDKFTNSRNLIEEFTAVGAPKLIYNGADDKYQPIMASEFQFNLMVNDKTDGKFFHLYTGNEKRYLVTVEDQDNNLLFEGYLLPDFYSEPYDNGVIFVDLTATDGIGSLKANFLPNQYYKQETSVIKLIAECLRFTKLDKNIVFAPAIESAATDYRWDEIAVNGAVYLEAEIEYRLFVGEVMPKRKNAYEILELLLESLGCTLYGQGDTWFIEGINRKHEENQLVYNYDKNGTYQSINTITKDIVDLTFFKTPTIDIVSPWKTVNIDWNIDEDGEMIPPKKLEGIPTGDVVFPSYEVSDFWKKTGQIGLNAYSKNFTKKWIIDGNLNIFQFGESEKPIAPFIFRSYYVPGTGLCGESLTQFESNYVSLSKLKYLKVSDEYVDRSFKVKILLHGAKENGGSFTTIDDGEFSKMFKYELRSNTSVILTSKFNLNSQIVEKLTCKIQEESTTLSNDMVAGDSYTETAKRVEASVQKEGVTLPNNGFFDVKLHAPISEVYTSPLFFGYTIAEMSIKYTEQKTWSDSFTREIDFTTVKDIDIFHGDSIQDLSEKQFRFRRPIFGTTGGFGTVTILSYEKLFPLQPWFYHYFISYQSYAAIIANPELFTVSFGGQDILMNDLSSGSVEAWSLTAGFGGVYFIQINSQLIDHPSGIGTNITDFLNLFVAESDVYIVGYLPEDNEWRESWKRYGQTENIRYGVAMGRIYHDVQPEALVKIEGTYSGCMFPREIGRFLWRNIKEFIPTRLTIDFTKGRTTALFLESLHQNVTDYDD